MKLKDRVAVITGAAQGIGKATALLFAQEGAKVVVVDRNAERGREVVTEIESAGGEALFVSCDVSRKDQVDSMVRAAVESFGTIDIVVNNAGVNHSADFFDITEADWDWVMSVDLKGAFLVSQAAARVVVDQGKGGAIVNLSSVMARLALADQIPYCAAKGGVSQLTTAMSLSLINYGIRVNAVAPGPVMTELMQRVVHNQEKHDKLMERLPIGYIASCEEIAQVILFLASDDSSYCIGQTIYADGGRSIQAFPSRLEKGTGAAG